MLVVDAWLELITRGAVLLEGEDIVSRLVFGELFGPHRKNWSDTRIQKDRASGACSRLGFADGERNLTPEMYERFKKTMAEVAQIPILIEDSSGLTTRELTARAALAVKRLSGSRLG
jgi:hypothetical protein